MNPPRWTVVSPSAYEWEREALEFLREHLPDHEPWRAWSNFEFVDDEGRVNEVDLLVLGPAGLVLVEIKSRPGTIEGDAHSWNWICEAAKAVAGKKITRLERAVPVRPQPHAQFTHVLSLYLLGPVIHAHHPTSH